MSLQGQEMLYGRPLPSREEALARLRRLTGQNFCADVQQWQRWLRKNWKQCYGPDRIANSSPPVIIDRAWLTPTVKALAQAIDEERCFQDMPILADALEDAGCTNLDLLDHCRQPGEHLRGCWALDALLGRE